MDAESSNSTVNNVEKHAREKKTCTSLPKRHTFFLHKLVSTAVQSSISIRVHFYEHLLGQGASKIANKMFVLYACAQLRTFAYLAEKLLNSLSNNSTAGANCVCIPQEKSRLIDEKTILS